MPLATPLTERLGISEPIICAPMGAVTGGALAGAVTRAGGLGLLGPGYAGPEWIDRELERAGDSAVGIGFITWYMAQHPEQLAAALAHRPAAVMLSFGDAAPHVEAIGKAGARLLMQVQTVAEARRAAELGADVIVAQGADGGGHGRSRGTLGLVPAVVDAVAPVPVAAAGGITDGRGLAAALALGADGALVGTRFYASDEALGVAAAKEALVRGGGDETVRTRVFDIVRGYDWARPYTGRALANAFVRRWHGHEGELEAALGEEAQRYRAAQEGGDTDTAVVWASEGIDLIDRVEPAARMVERLSADARQCLGALAVRL